MFSIGEAVEQVVVRRRVGCGIGPPERPPVAGGIARALHGELAVDVGRVEIVAGRRLERRRKFLGVERRPVDRREERMRLDGLGAVMPQALVRVAFQQALQQVNSVRGKLFRELDVAMQDLIVHDVGRLGIERGQAGHHFEEQRPQAPPVHRMRIPATEQNFGAQVFRRPNERVRLLARLQHLRQTEIGDAKVPTPVEKDILRFQVAVNDALQVEVLQRQDDLGGVETGAILLESSFHFQPVEQLAAVDIVQDEVEFGGRLERIPKGDQERVPLDDIRQHVPLSTRVRHLAPLHDLALVQDLHGVDLASVDLANLQDLGERSLADDGQ